MASDTGLISIKGRSRERGKSLTRSLYERYILVVIILLALIGGMQVQSLHSALVLGGEGSLVFAYRDALTEPAFAGLDSENAFRDRAPTLLAALSIHGINARLYDVQLHQVGESRSRYDPVELIPISPQVAARARQLHVMPINKALRAYVTHVGGQILLFAALGPPGAVVGYAELGYRESLLYPIIAQQGLTYFGFSVLVAILAAALLFPLVGAPLKPLRRLTESALRIREGEPGERLPAIGTVETVRLAEVINDVLDKLATAAAREQESAQRMKEFISAASHELRTPLTAIRGFADVLQRRVQNQRLAIIPSAEIGQALTTMQREIARLETLVRDLLQLARLDEGVSPALETVDLSQLVSDLRPQLEMISTGRTLAFDLSPAVTRCDRAMFEQVLYNLVTNSVHYTATGTGEIRIQVLQLPEGRALLRVSDNGEGIAPEQLERIFDRFFRASSARVRNPGGAGLGLSIVSEIVRAHGGHIDAQSTRGRGTTMTVDL